MSTRRGTFKPEDFKEDESCQIDNPLRYLSPSELSDRATQFAHLVGMEPSDGHLAKFIKDLACRAKLTHRPDPSQPTVNHTDEALISLFQKAAQVAQNPLKIDGLEILSEYEKFILKNDRDLHFWDQPKTLRVTVVTLCFSAIVQGWIQSGGNGANQNWPYGVGIASADGEWIVANGKWIFAGVNAIPYLAASIFGCWLSDPLQSAILGRRGAIFVSALFCFASLIGSAFVSNWKQLMVCRALVGLGLGAKASVTPIFGAEISPSHIRGALVMNWQLFDAFGIWLGFTANLIFSVSTSSWRPQFASACVPTFCLLTLIWVIPESPRWLLKQRRHREAFKSLCSLRETELQAATELFYANAQLQIEAKMQPQKQKDPEKNPETPVAEHMEHIEARDSLSDFQNTFAKTTYFSRFAQLFRNPRTRRSTIAASIVMICQQLCGINVIIFYSSTFFRDTRGTVPTTSDTPTDDRHRAIQALWLSWGVGLANFIFTFPAYFLIDTRGRRFLLFCTYPGMILSMLAACLSFLHQQALDFKVAFFMFVFVFFYSWGQGPVAFAYSSEVFPLINREAGMSFAVFINLLGAGILTLFVPLAQSTEQSVLANKYNVGQAKLLGIFVGLDVLALVLIFFFVPETAGATIRKKEDHDRLSYMKLEELNYIFNVKTWKHVSYQVRHVLPYAASMINWYLCRHFSHEMKRPTKPKKMWVWVDEKNDQEAEKETAGKMLHSSGHAQEERTVDELGMVQRSRVQALSK